MLRVPALPPADHIEAWLEFGVWAELDNEGNSL